MVVWNLSHETTLPLVIPRITGFDIDMDFVRFYIRISINPNYFNGFWIRTIINMRLFIYKYHIKSKQQKCHRMKAVYLIIVKSMIIFYSSILTTCWKTQFASTCFELTQSYFQEAARLIFCYHNQSHSLNRFSNKLHYSTKQKNERTLIIQMIYRNNTYSINMNWSFSDCIS